MLFCSCSRDWSLGNPQRPQLRLRQSRRKRFQSWTNFCKPEIMSVLFLYSRWNTGKNSFSWKFSRFFSWKAEEKVVQKNRKLLLLCKRCRHSEKIKSVRFFQPVWPKQWQRQRNNRPVDWLLRLSSRRLQKSYAWVRRNIKGKETPRGHRTLFGLLLFLPRNVPWG